MNHTLAECKTYQASVCTIRKNIPQDQNLQKMICKKGKPLKKVFTTSIYRVSINALIQETIVRLGGNQDLINAK